MKQARRMHNKLKVYRGRVYRDVQRKIAAVPAYHKAFQHLLGRIGRLLTQQRHDKGKLYRVHAPEVVCVAKGKAHKPYEFGVKVSVATTQASTFVVGRPALRGIPMTATHWRDNASKLAT